MLLAGGLSSRGPAGFLSPRPLQVIGRYSYSIYLWHWPVILLLIVPPGGPVRDATGRSVAALVVTGVLAAASFHLVERPFRRSPWLLARRGRSVGFGAALVVLSLLSIMVFRATLDESLDAGRPVALEPRELSGATRRHGVRADQRPAGAARRRHHRRPPTWRGRNTCPSGRICARGDPRGRPRHGGGRRLPCRPSPARPGAAGAAPRLGRLPAEPWGVLGLRDRVPGLLRRRLVGGRRDPAGHRGALELPPPDHPGREQETIEQLARSVARAPAGARVVLVGETPSPGIPVPHCLADHLDDARACEPPPHDADPVNRVLADGAERIGIPFVDLTPLICTPQGRCPAIAGNVLVYIDGNHLAPDFMTSRSEDVWTLVQEATT